SVERYATYRHTRAGCTGIAIAATPRWCWPKAIVARDSLGIERSRRGRRPGVRIAGHKLVAQSRDRDRVTGCTYPRSNAIAIHFLDRRRKCRVGTVRIVVPCAREGGRRHYRRIHVLGLPRHEGEDRKSVV